jgi:hypothetical protein
LKNAKNLTSIGSRAFAKCKSLKTVELPSNVEAIGKDAFHGCTALTDLRLNDGLTKIGVGALSECTRLREVIVPFNRSTNLSFQHEKRKPGASFDHR